MDPAPAPAAPKKAVSTDGTSGALSNREIANKAFNTCAKAVNDKIPGSFGESSTTTDKMVKAGSIGGLYAVSVLSGYTVPLIAGTAFVGCVAYKAFKLAQLENSIETNQPWKPISGSAPLDSIEQHEQFTTKQISDWLFDGERNAKFPPSTLANKQDGRLQANFYPKISFSEIEMISEDGKYTHRIGIHPCGITDIKADKGLKAAVGDSNNGDLLTGCGAFVATAIINAAGPNLQRDLYNTLGVPTNKSGAPSIMAVPKYGAENYPETEGRGYSLTCDSHDMKRSHNIQSVEFMTVPYKDNPENVEGIRNMYYEAFVHSADLDFIVLPMAGVTHPVLKGKPELSAQLAMEAFKDFVDDNPSSNLKVVFAIFDPGKKEGYEDIYRAAAKEL